MDNISSKNRTTKVDLQDQELIDLEDSLANIYSIKDPIKQRYILAKTASNLNIPLDLYSRIYDIYALQQLENEALRSKWKAPIIKFKQNIEPFTRFIISLSSLSIFIGVITFIAEIPQRTAQQQAEQRRSQYEAWRIVTASEGKEASGGRITALQDLNKDKINLAGLNAERAILLGINLKGAALGEANLQRAALSKANLSKADLRGAKLNLTTLVGANLSEAVLYHADLRGAFLDRANLREADLSSSNLTGATLNSSDLRGTKMNNTNLSGANLFGANLLEASLNNANLDKVVYDKATKFPSGFKLSQYKAYLVEPGVDLNGVDLAGANLATAPLSNSRLVKTNLSNTDLYNVDFTNADINGAIFRNAQNLTLKQVKSARNWEKAQYDEVFAIQLGLTPKLPGRN